MGHQNMVTRAIIFARRAPRKMSSFRGGRPTLTFRIIPAIGLRVLFQMLEMSQL